MDTISRDIDEAALIDGCSRFKNFFYIAIPLALPGIAAAAIVVFINSWNEFTGALTFVRSDSLRTLPIGIMVYKGYYEVSWNNISAAAILSCLPVIVVFLILQKSFVSGLTAGAVKG